MIIRVKHANATRDVEIQDPGSVYTTVGAALGLPASRVTIIRAGKKLPPQGDAALADAIVPGALYLVTGTRQEDALPSTARRHANDARDAAIDLYTRFTWDFFVALCFWMWAQLLALGRACGAFVVSMVVPPAPAVRRDQAPPQHADLPPG